MLLGHSIAVVEVGIALLLQVMSAYFVRNFFKKSFYECIEHLRMIFITHVALFSQGSQSIISVANFALVTK
jgi:hypothetical protein